MGDEDELGQRSSTQLTMDSSLGDPSMLSERRRPKDGLAVAIDDTFRRRRRAHPQHVEGYRDQHPSEMRIDGGGGSTHEYSRGRHDEYGISITAP